MSVAPRQRQASEPLRVALAGNPNAGKTSLFNALTGMRARVGNYPGVTVEQREGSATLPGGGAVRIIDVPGCYSLVARSMDEEIAHDVLIGQGDRPPVDVIVAVADASNLARNLYLALQLAELGRPLIIALNMMDLATRAGLTIDAVRLSRGLGGVPVVPIVARTGEGIDTLLTAIASAPAAPDLAPPLEPADAERVAALRQTLIDGGEDRSLGHTLWLLTSTDAQLDRLPPTTAAAVREARLALDAPLDTKRPATFARRLIAARYALIDRAVGAATVQERPVGPARTERVDRVLTHPLWGMGIFILAMVVLFQAVYSWSEPLIGGIETAMAALAGVTASTLPEGVLRELIVHGLIAGVGNILVFLPQILLLFLAIAILEDTGYMSRVAFLLDRVMRRVGLHGKAFVPLLSSFACAIPGVMAARTIESSRDRLVTIMIAPLMSCSARLPVYTLVIGAVFSTADPVFGVLSLAGLIITAMYFLGIFAALGVAWLFKRTVLRSPPAPFVLELPSYKAPSPAAVLEQMYRRGKVFVTQTGRVILALSVILWAMMAYPRTPLPETERAEVLARTAAASPDEQATALNNREEAYRLRHSVAGTLGRAIEPAIEPLGFDWKIGIGLIGSFAAREVLVSTLGQVYGLGAAVDEEAVVLREALVADKDPATGEARFTPLVGVSLMVFFVLAMQCLSTVAVVKRETASWRWPIIMIVYMNVLAWLGSFATFQIGRALGFG